MIQMKKYLCLRKSLLRQFWIMQTVLFSHMHSPKAVIFFLLIKVFSVSLREIENDKIMGHRFFLTPPIFRKHPEQQSMPQMKYIIIALILFISHCQSVSNYLQYRAYDFRDMFTIGVEKNVAGGSFYIWCFGAGVQYGSHGEGYGLRGGNLGKYITGHSGEIPPFRSLTRGKFQRSEIPSRKETYVPLSYGSSIFIVNTLEYVPTDITQIRYKGKSYSSISLFILPYPPILPSYCEYDPEFCRLSKLGRKCEMPLQFEGSLGLYYGLRFGFNFYEALDFITGIFGADILEDDTLAPMTEKDRREMLSEIHLQIRGVPLPTQDIGEICSAEKLCINSVCLDGKCFEKGSEDRVPWKCNEKGCGVSGASCKLDTECKGICINGKCQ